MFDTDGFPLLSALVQFGVYLFALGAAGSALALFSLNSLSSQARAQLIRQLGFAAVAAAALSVCQLVVRAWFLTGGSILDAYKPTIFAVLINGPEGQSLKLRLVGLLLLLAALIPRRMFAAVGAVGAVLVCLSFALRGHSVAGPQAMLMPLYTVHMLAIAYWLGGLRPLHLLAHWDLAQAADLAEEFGRKAVTAVAALILSGGAMLLVLNQGGLDLLASLWGRILILKLGFVAAILGLAAANKLWLAPALRKGRSVAGRRLRQSIRMEFRLMLVVFALTAILTSISSPPGVN